jgi:ABC-type uncharacterized transport system fused permease/ATPase subunit
MAAPDLNDFIDAQITEHRKLKIRDTFTKLFPTYNQNELTTFKANKPVTHLTHVCPKRNDDNRITCMIDRKYTFKKDPDQIIFKDVPILSPNSDILIPKMSFEISLGMYLMITSLNGYGKSSHFRNLGELWPGDLGTLHDSSFHSKKDAARFSRA